MEYIGWRVHSDNHELSRLWRDADTCDRHGCQRRRKRRATATRVSAMLVSIYDIRAAGVRRSLGQKTRRGIGPCDPEKLRAGVERAVEKWPVSEEAVDGLVERVDEALTNRDTRIVSSHLTGDLVAE